MLRGKEYKEASGLKTSRNWANYPFTIDGEMTRCQLLVNRFDPALCCVLNWKASASSGLFGLDKNRWSGRQITKREWCISRSLQHLERWQPLYTVQGGDKDWGRQKTQCPCVQIFQLPLCHRAVCDPVEFYQASRLIHLWTEDKHKIFHPRD